ncbi:MAG TPA: glucan biosynthesis protein D [Candidatus Competibacteraceae bacterium]|nr:glucan biosynthesis protein D [Candidatus Competibacteraceae bacterium]
MKLGITRRTFLAGALLSPWLRYLGREVRAEESTIALDLGPAQPFSFDGLKEQARQLASQPYHLPVTGHADILERIDYDAYRQIRFRPEASLWAKEGPYAVQFFHQGKLFQVPVKMYLVKEGVAREIHYSPRLFTFGKTDFATTLPDDLGFAGFRVREAGGKQREWLAFLGASYFRSPGELDQWGLSARGIAVGTGLPTPEEFPYFIRFWLEPAQDPKALMIYALLDGPSLSGAYRMQAAYSGRVTMDIEAVLFPRTAIPRLGIAPMTSMFWYSETNHMQSKDWRPEIHDSDGLAMWTGTGERIWRPLNNPPFVQTSSFFDNNPKGFGLFQRDRDFAHYLDIDSFYDRRPSLWVEPLEPWGEGAVQLVEIPTDIEVDDNIVAYWVPKAPIQAGSTWTFKYRLYWVADDPYWPNLGRVIGTYFGRGGVAGLRHPPPNKSRIVIDFAGGPLDQLDAKAPVQLVLTVSSGKVEEENVTQVTGTKQWRAFFDIEPENMNPVDIRAYLRLGDRTLTETWLYQYLPYYRTLLG